jgi:hypothetical protein
MPFPLVVQWKAVLAVERHVLAGQSVIPVSSVARVCWCGQKKVWVNVGGVMRRGRCCVWAGKWARRVGWSYIQVVPQWPCIPSSSSCQVLGRMAWSCCMPSLQWFSVPSWRMCYVLVFCFRFVFYNNFLHCIGSSFNAKYLTFLETLCFYGAQRFTTMFTKARHLTLSRVTWIQSTPRTLCLQDLLILILSCHLSLGLTRSSDSHPYFVFSMSWVQILAWRPAV